MFSVEHPRYRYLVSSPRLQTYAARILRIGPRKRAALLLGTVAVIGLGFLSNDWFVTTMVGFGGVVLLATGTAVLELLRWRQRTHGRYQRLLTRNIQITDQLERQHEKHIGLVRREQNLAARNKRLASELALWTRDQDEDRNWRDLRSALVSPCAPARQRLFVFPPGNENDYLKLLYQEFPMHGFEVIPAKPAAMDGLRRGDIFHLHWTKWMLARCKSETEAHDAVDVWLERLNALRRQGVHLIWSVHEELPHECNYLAAELRLRRGICELVDIVHVLDEATAELVRDSFEIPAKKELIAPHPTYAGTLPDHLRRESLRRDLGFGADDVLLIGLGSIRPYKGYERVIRLLPQLNESFPSKRIRFLIAGNVQADPEVQAYRRTLEELIASLERPESVVLHARKVSRYYLGVLLQIADLSVAPYTSGGNSGVLMLNMTFGLPTVITANPIIDSIAVNGPVTTCPAGDDDALLAGITRVLADSPSRQVKPEFSAQYAPDKVSADFAEALRQRLGLPSL